MDIYSALQQNTSAVSRLERDSDGEVQVIDINSKDVEFDYRGETYSASDVIERFRNSSDYEETDFLTFEQVYTGPSTGLIVSAYIFAPLLPIIGIILGIVVGAKGSAKHAAGSIILSIISWLFWASMMM